jgi:flagellar protein FlaH
LDDDVAVGAALDSDEQVPIISTGNSEIDSRLGGGIPVGSLTLIEGQSASGKSVLTQQFTWGSLYSSHKVIVYTTERTVVSQTKQMESLGLDGMDFLLLSRLKICPIYGIGEMDRRVVLKALTDDMARMNDFDLVIVDALTSMVIPSAVIDTIAFFERCRALCVQGKTIVVTLHSYSIDDNEGERIRSMCDATLNLRIESIGDQFVNVMEVTKVGGATRSTGNVLSFAVEPMIGLRIIPLSYARI